MNEGSCSDIWQVTLKVSDFGLSRFLPLDEKSITLSKAKGTLGYWAPEVQRGDR